MLIRRYFVGIEEISLFLILFSTTPSDAQTTPPGPCVVYFQDLERQTFGSGSAIFSNRTTSESDELGTVIYQLSWDVEGIPARLQGELFNNHFDVDESLENHWTITLKKKLTGLPDYPLLDGEITATTTFTGFIGYSECDFWLSISVEDTNTQTPESVETSYTISIRENFPIDFDVPNLDVNIRDNDYSEPNNVVEVSMEPNCPIAPFPTQYKDFTGDFKSVNFILVKELDYETEPSHTCYVNLEDKGDPMLSALIKVEIQVNDIQDEPPIFTSPLYYTELSSPEPEIGGTPLSPDPIPIEAFDGDIGAPSPITYSMTDFSYEIEGTSYFSINSQTGVVLLMKVLDDEMLKNNRIYFVLTATDESGEFDGSILEVILPTLPKTSLWPTTIDTSPPMISTIMA